MKEEHSRRVIQWLVPAICMTVIIIVMVFNFFTTIKLEGANLTQEKMTDSAERCAEKLHNDLQMAEMAGEMAASFLSEEKVSDVNTVKAALNALLSKTPAYEAVFNKGDGTGIRNDGKQINLMDCSYYWMLYQASGVRYIHVEDDGITGEEAILIIIPLKESVMRNILLFYPMERVKTMIKPGADFEGEAFSALINIDGAIIQQSDGESAFLKDGNLWENVPNTYKSVVTKAKVQIMNHTSGCLAAVSGAEERTLVYASVYTNEWALVVGVNQQYVNKKQMEYWHQTSKMLYQLLAVILFFFAIFVAIYIIGKKRSEENDRLLREKADTDLLTGLNNKLATERKIKSYMEENPNSLAMMFVLDIDNFKKINDTMGHVFGDEVLRNLGRQVGSVFRATDIIGRTGGDEFTIFLKFLKDDSNTLKEAQKLANFFKDFTTGEYVKYTATASIGAAVFPAHGSDFESLYKSADKALYKAKQRGKNQLAFYDDRDRKQKEEVLQAEEKQEG